MEVFGKLKVIGVVKDKNRTMTQVECKCGTVKLVHVYDLKAGKLTSCGKCRNTELAIGTVFGKLTVMSLYKENVTWFVKVQCECGNVKIVRKSNLTKGSTTTCGCGVRGLPFPKNHGYGGSASYGTWRHMMQRCYNPSDKDYRIYGARGITVCDRWHNVANFIKDMGERHKGFSIERIDVNGNYTIGNCVWLPHNLQSKNRTKWKHTDAGLKAISDSRKKDWNNGVYDDKVTSQRKN